MHAWWSRTPEAEERVLDGMDRINRMSFPDRSCQAFPKAYQFQFHFGSLFSLVHKFGEAMAAHFFSPL